MDIKHNVINTLKAAAPIYKANFIDTTYLVCSAAFVNSPYYIIRGAKENFAHLSGIKNQSDDFFEKCMSETIGEDDFELPTKDIKLKAKSKISVLLPALSLFQKECFVQEDYKKNMIKCSIAGTNGIATIGFSKPSKQHVVRPMTLLKGNKLDPSKYCKVDLILAKKAGSNAFDTIVVGDKEMVKNFDLGNLISQNLLCD